MKSRFTAAEKAEVLAVVERTRERTGWSLERILKRLGLTRTRYHEWRRRAERAPFLASGLGNLPPAE